MVFRSYQELPRPSPRIEAPPGAIAKRLASALARETSSGLFIPEIDGLRFVSIALVVLYHAVTLVPSTPPFLALIGKHGNFGVRMFFAISGFILGLPFAEQHLNAGRPISLRRYFLRRLTRLEPPYIINLLLWTAIKVALLRRAFASLAPHLLASLTYSHNLFYLAPSDINFYAWSLEVEVQFYTVAPLLASVFRVRARAIRLALLAGAILVLGMRGIVLDPAAAKVVELTLAGQAEWFLVGFVLADIHLVTWKKRPQRGHLWDALSAVAWPCLFALVHLPSSSARLAWLSPLLAPWVVLACYVGAFRGQWASSLLRWRPIYIIGGMCYSIYLYHGYPVILVGKVLPRIQTGVGPVDAAVGLGSIGACAVAVGTLAFVLFEKPFMNPTWYRSAWSRIRSYRWNWT